MVSLEKKFNLQFVLGFWSLALDRYSIKNVIIIKINL